MTNQQSETQRLVAESVKLLKRGKRLEARRLAESALVLDNQCEDAWLILAATASTKASIEYFNQVLSINPSNKYAINGLHWAEQKQKTESQFEHQPSSLISSSIPTQNLYRKRISIIPLIIILSALLIGVFAFFHPPAFSSNGETSTPNQLNDIVINKNTRTPTFTATTTPTPTPTQTPTFTPTSTPTLTNTPTNTPLPSNTPDPTATRVKKKSIYSEPPKGIKGNQKWIDVNLSKQRLIAYEGSNKVKKFIVSTVHGNIQQL